MELDQYNILLETDSADGQPEKADGRVTMVDTLIVSDIHLGSYVSRSKDLLKTLKKHDMKRLILNGDVFDDLNFKRLNKSDWEFLSYLRKLANPKRECEVVWVAGNHDGAAEILSHLLGVQVFEEYMWESHGRKFLAIHGHQFDKYITDHLVLTSIACAFYIVLQRLDGKNQRFSRWIKQRSKKWLRVSESLGHDAIQYAAKKGADVVFCGHTHRSVQIETDDLIYYNSGCWTDFPSHFLSIDRGQVEVCEA